MIKKIILADSETKIKVLERVISDIWDIVGECGDSGDTEKNAHKLSRIEARLLDFEDDYALEFYEIIEVYDGPE